MKRLEIGVVGAGWIVDKHLRAIGELGDRARVVAICDPDNHRATAMAEAFNVPHILGNYDDLVLMDQINTVLVAIPTMLHADAAVAAARADKHVVCEKPMAATVADCRRMIDAARRHEVCLIPGHNRLFFPPIVKARQIIEAGALGQPRLFRGSFLTPYHPALATGDQGQSWRVDPSFSGGGILMEAGVHVIYTAQDLLGPVCSVQAQMQRITATDTEDSVIVQLEFESKALGSIVLQNDSGYPDDGFQVLGTEGMVQVNGVELQAMRGPPLAIYGKRDASWQLPDAAWSWDESFTGMWAHVADVIMDGRRPLPAGVDGLRVIEVIEAVYHAARTGQRTQVTRS
jgi:predicted dehydrogenase